MGRLIDQWDPKLRKSVETLNLEEWFVRGHYHDREKDNIDGFWIPKCRPGTFIWITSPRVARIVI